MISGLFYFLTNPTGTPNSDNPDVGIGKQTKSSQGEGYDNQHSGISGEVWNRLEADLSESFWNRQDKRNQKEYVDPE